MELAIWFHDAIYDPRRHDNEEKSAELASQHVPLPPERIQTVKNLILATRHSTPPGNFAEALLVDIDLSILGKPPERFDEYEQQIRAEYDFVPSETFRAKRMEVLQSFLARPKLFTTSRFFELYERSARENLDRSISRLAVSR